jgi:hypothetical protein
VCVCVCLYHNNILRYVYLRPLCDLVFEDMLNRPAVDDGEFEARNTLTLQK